MRFVLLAAGAVLLGPPVSAGGLSALPSLRLVSAQPAVVRGLHFAHRESVRVSFSAGGKAATRVVRSSKTGAFNAPEPVGFDYSPCGSPLLVVATGARGDRAMLKVPQRECP